MYFIFYKYIQGFLCIISILLIDFNYLFIGTSMILHFSSQWWHHFPEPFSRSRAPEVLDHVFLIEEKKSSCAGLILITKKSRLFVFVSVMVSVSKFLCFSLSLDLIDHRKDVAIVTVGDQCGSVVVAIGAFTTMLLIGESLVACRYRLAESRQCRWWFRFVVPE